MYRKVVFSKEPTVLKLESSGNDDAAFVHLKHRSQAFYIGARRDQFGVYPGDLAVSTLSQAYFTVTPIPAPASTPASIPEYQFNCDRIKTKQIHCSNALRFSNNAQISGTSGGQLNLTVPSAHSVFQFGHETVPWVTLRSNVFHFNGDICCQNLYTSSNTPTPTPVPAPVPVSGMSVLDANGKIPMAYLPEVYQTSLIHNDVGVGIGTDAPLQKFHLEGNGFIRGRLAIGDRDAAAATLHLRPTAFTPGLRVDAAADAPAIEVYDGASPSPSIQMGMKGVYIKPPIVATAITTDTLTIPEKLYYRHNRLNITAPTHIQAPLVVRSIASEDARPLALDAPVVECSNISTRGWTYPLNPPNPPNPPATQNPLNPPNLAMSFQASRLSLTDGTLTLDDRAWKEAYQRGDEVARLTMPDDSHIELTRVIAFLWTTVQELRERVHTLEQKS